MSTYLARSLFRAVPDAQHVYRPTLLSRSTRALSCTPRFQQLQPTSRSEAHPSATIQVPKSTKIWASAEEAIKDINSGSLVLSAGGYGRSSQPVLLSNPRSLLSIPRSSPLQPALLSSPTRAPLLSNPRAYQIHSTGFGLCGVPQTLINAIRANEQIQDLTVVSNNAGNSGSGGLCESRREHRPCLQTQRTDRQQ